MKKSLLKIKKFFIIIVIIILILVLVNIPTKIVSRTIGNIKHSFFRLLEIESREGNSIANIVNYGQIVEDKKNIYYVIIDNKKPQINKIVKENKKKIAEERTVIVEGNWEISGLNIYGDYIYFTTISNVDSNDEKMDNKIHKIRKDGTDHKVINDNEFVDDGRQIFVVDNKVYYIGLDQCIWTMNLDGEKKTKLNDNKSGFIGITDDYIFYNAYVNDVVTNEKTIVTYYMKRNGKDAKPVTGERLYDISVVDDYIYYLNDEQYIHKVKKDGSEDKLLSDDKAYHLNVAKSGIYFLTYTYNNGNINGMNINKMDLNGKNLIQLEKSDSKISDMSIINDWAFYKENNSKNIKWILLSLNGKQSYRLNTIDYLSYDEDSEKKVDDDSNGVKENIDINNNEIEQNDDFVEDQEDNSQINENEMEDFSKGNIETVE